MVGRPPARKRALSGNNHAGIPILNFQPRLSVAINVQMSKLSGKVIHSTGPRRTGSEPLPHTDGKSRDAVFNTSKPQGTAVRIKGSNACPGQQKALLSIVSTAATTASYPDTQRGRLPYPNVRSFRGTQHLLKHTILNHKPCGLITITDSPRLPPSTDVCFGTTIVLVI